MSRPEELSGIVHRVLYYTKKEGESLQEEVNRNSKEALIGTTFSIVLGVVLAVLLIMLLS